MNEPNEQPGSEPERTFDLREFSRPIVIHKWVVLGVALAVGLGVVFWTLKQPKIYEATTTIEYDPNPTQPLGHTVEDVGSPVAGYLMSQEFFETQNHIIASRTISERVVRRLGLHRDPSFMDIPLRERAAWHGVEPVAAAERLQDMLSVEPVKDTRIVNLTVKDVSPARARLLADAIADSYIDKTLEDRMSATVSALEWLSTQLDTLQQQLEGSELALHEFKEQNNVLSVSMEDRQNLVAADMESLNKALTETRIKRIELAARARQLRVAVEADALTPTSSAIAANSTIAGLREQLRTKMSERDSIAVRYGDGHPRMIGLTAEIGSLADQVRAETRSMMESAESDLREANQVESGLRGALAEANRAGLELNLREIDYGRLSRARESKAKVYNLLLERTAETDLTRMLRVTHVRLVDRALVPVDPVSPRFSTNASAGAGAGIALGVLLAFGLARLDRRLRSAEQVERLGATVLGIVPRIDAPTRAAAGASAEPDFTRDLVVAREPRSAAAECVRTVRTNLAFMSATAPIRSLVVTSGNPGEGKSTVCVSLAVALAQTGKTVLIVDSDLRRPRLHRVFGRALGEGVTSILVGEKTLADVVIQTEVPNLFVLPCGPIPPNPAELLHSVHFSEMLRDMLSKYDRVLFDSPPLGAVIDAAVLGPQLDGVVVVIKAESTTRDSLTSTLRQLKDVSAVVRGVVVNDVDVSQKEYGYGRSGYYTYYNRDGYYGTPENAPGEAPPRPNAS